MRLLCASRSNARFPAARPVGGSGYGTVGPAGRIPEREGTPGAARLALPFVRSQPAVRGVIHHGSLVRRLREWPEAKTVEDAQDLRSTRGGGVRAERDV